MENVRTVSLVFEHVSTLRKSSGSVGSKHPYNIIKVYKVCKFKSTVQKEMALGSILRYHGLTIMYFRSW